MLQKLKSIHYSESVSAILFSLIFAGIGAGLILSSYALTTTSNTASSTCSDTAAGQPGDLCGFFIVHCLFDHTSHDDPIVFFDVPAATHQHEFFGAKGINYTSTPTSLLGQPSTCDNADDTGGYWTPAAEMNGQPIGSLYQNEYWFDGGFKKTEMMPFGMELVAGNARSTAPEPTNVAFYYCGTGTPKLNKPYTCSSGDLIIMVVVFPQCWNGVVQIGNDAANMAYPSSPGHCPSGYTHVFPRLEEHVHLPIASPYDSHGNFVFSLSSGPYYTLHGDFINSWKQPTLDRFFTNCINSHQSCKSNTPSGPASLPIPAAFPNPSPPAPTPSPSPSPSPSPTPAPVQNSRPSSVSTGGSSNSSGSSTADNSASPSNSTDNSQSGTSGSEDNGISNQNVNNPNSSTTSQTPSSTPVGLVASKKTQHPLARHILEALGWTVLIIGIPIALAVRYSQIVQSR
ncbi:MAG TPA: DUF1996 domain-containing protein [Candidatus Saccharimonadales bacterium]|nr:DUF1996 domain-containing protein [Candidatus Saccharimonadales bacterium]